MTGRKMGIKSLPGATRKITVGTKSIAQTVQKLFGFLNLEDPPTIVLPRLEVVVTLRQTGNAVSYF